MPRKGRDFELAYKELSELDIEKYRVSSPAWIYDRTTGVKREVDVLIEYNDTDGHLRWIAVECRDHKDKLNVMWIEQLITKRNDLELDFLIAVTTSDFTEGAILKARHHGVIIEKAELFNKTLVEEISGEFYVDLFFLRFSLIECKCLIGGSVISIKELLQKLSLIRQQELLHFINTDLYFSVEPNEVMDKEDFDMEMFYDHPDNSFIEFEADSFYCDNEHCKAVFVTTNTTLAKTANKYYREHVKDRTFPLVITDADLAALTWIKCGSVGDLPERQLLRNAYMAMQPAPEMIEKFSSILDQMQTEGKLTTEVAIVLRSSGFARKEEMFASFEGEESINEDLINTIEAKLREESSAAARDDERQKAEREKQEEQNARITNAYQQARIKSTEIINKKLIRWRRILLVVGLVIIGAAIAGLVVSIISVHTSHIIVTIILSIFAVLSVFGIIDSYKEREKFLYKLLVHLAAKRYDEIYDRLSKEYVAIAEGEKEKVD